MTFAAGEITSKNVVGYAQKADALNPNAGTIISTQFANVGDDAKFMMKDLLPEAKVAEASSLEYNVNAQLQNDDGTCDDDNNFSWNGVNWEDQNGTDVSNRKIDAGTAIKIFLTTDECYLQSAGQVSASPAEIPLADAAGTNVGNPFPVDVAFGDIAVIGDDYGYNVNVQLQNEDGSCYDENNFSWTGSGWEDQSGTDVSDVLFKRGSGARAFLTAADISIYIPVPKAIENLK